MSETKERFVLREVEGSYGTREELIDTVTGRVVGADGGEAEDNSFLRDWHWVPTEMNKLAAEIESLRAERDALRGECSEYAQQIRDINNRSREDA